MTIMNGVKSYFERNWTREDMMNLDEIPLDVHRSLKKVYLTLFCAMLTATFGSFMNLISVAGGKFTVLSYIASLIWIYFTPPGRVKTRVLLTMLASYSFGASVAVFTRYLLKIEQRYVLRLLVGTTIGLGNFLFGAITSRQRSRIYWGCLKYGFVLILSGVVFFYLDSLTAIWIVNIHCVQTLFMGYIVVYSQEILYDANFGDINFVNRTFTVFFNLPAIVIHAARLYLQGAEIEQHGQN